MTSKLAATTGAALITTSKPSRLRLLRNPLPRIAMAKFRTMENFKDPQTGRTTLGVSATFKGPLRACATGESRWPLTLIADAGVGKTCAALALADFVDGRCRIQTLEELCETRSLIRQNKPVAFYGYREEKWTDAFLWVQTSELALLIVDEIGIRPNQSWDADLHLNTLKRILDIREGKPTILTSNKRLKDLYELYDERVVSRLTAGTIVESQESDRRPLI